MHIFYDPHIATEAKDHILSEEESAHACRVLRLKTGDEIELLNGKGDSFKAVISDAHPKKCVLRILDRMSHQKPDYSVHIAIAPTKNMERLEWFAEKTTELGITHITLLLCKNNERKVVKTDRLEKILVSAMKQSKRKFLPILTELIPFKDFIKENPKGLIAHCYNGEKSFISESWEKLNFPILIGPEGDFSMDEVELALKSGFKAIHLGENRLRTETAGLYACMQAIQKAEELNN
jgi:16S rRNA (uracil1498-N3)-methyltransferase